MKEDFRRNIRGHTLCAIVGVHRKRMKDMLPLILAVTVCSITVQRTTTTLNTACSMAINARIELSLTANFIWWNVLFWSMIYVWFLCISIVSVYLYYHVFYAIVYCYILILILYYCDTAVLYIFIRGNKVRCVIKNEFYV